MGSLFVTTVVVVCVGEESHVPRLCSVSFPFGVRFGLESFQEIP